jgi:hypothetical protein
MALANPGIDYATELANLRKIYTEGAPQARLNTILKRLQDCERDSGAAFLATLVSAVEALARSLLVWAAKPTTVSEFLRAYEIHQRSPAVVLVEAVLRLHNIPDPSTHLPDDTWLLFKHSVDFRNVIVHECTYLGQDKYPSLIEATREVLAELVKKSGLRMT